MEAVQSLPVWGIWRVSLTKIWLEFVFIKVLKLTGWKLYLCLKVGHFVVDFIERVVLKPVLDEHKCRHRRDLRTLKRKVMYKKVEDIASVKGLSEAINYMYKTQKGG